ncbi:MAG: type III pantothenate kinase [Deltaproteobacteria bacterium]
MKVFVIDAGNSYIKMEAYEGEESLGMWQFETSEDINEETMIAEIENNFSKLGILKNNFNGIVTCSVVPEITSIIQKSLSKVFKNKPVINVTSHTNTGLIIPNENKRIGADRIADMVGAARIYTAPAVVVNMGTATVFTVLDDNMRILGGQIIAGGDIALQALLKRSTNIFKIMTVSDNIITRIKPVATDVIIGRNTEENIISGAFWGLASQVEGISSIIKKELIKIGISQNKIKIIVTGGLSNIYKDFKFVNVDYIDPDLTRKGLRIIGEMNLCK